MFKIYLRGENFIETNTPKVPSSIKVDILLGQGTFHKIINFYYFFIKHFKIFFVFEKLQNLNGLDLNLKQIICKMVGGESIFWK
jgi:hypothetical protein